jgi:hypothetical protein
MVEWSDINNPETKRSCPALGRCPKILAQTLNKNKNNVSQQQQVQLVEPPNNQVHSNNA